MKQQQYLSDSDVIQTGLDLPANEFAVDGTNDSTGDQQLLETNGPVRIVGLE